MALVYCATNKINGKRYIGITSKSLVHRITKHRNSTDRVSSCVFHCAIRKYGFDSFSWEILKENIDYAEALVSEKEYIELFRTFVGSDGSEGYNMTLGGEGSLGTRASVLCKEKNSQFLKDNEKSKHVHAARIKALSIKVIRHDGLVFDSMIEASIASNVSVTGIQRCVSGKFGQSQGFGWKQYGGIIETWIPASKKGVKRPVIRSDGLRFSSSSEAERLLGYSRGSVNAVCNGIQKSTQGFTWRFI